MKIQYYSEIFGCHYSTQEACEAAEAEYHAFDIAAFRETPASPDEVVNLLRSQKLATSCVVDRHPGRVRFSSLPLWQALLSRFGSSKVNVNQIDLTYFPKIAATLKKLHDARKIRDANTTQALSRERSKAMAATRRGIAADHAGLQERVAKIHALSREIREIQKDIQREAELAHPMGVMIDDAKALLASLPAWTQKF